ncbi:peptide synthase [Paucimonas lemoignei]|nr:peptide synthase [Paucimonas lemoignei]
MNQINQQPDHDLLALLLADEQGASDAIRAGSAEGPGVLSFAQQRLWLLQQLAPDSAAYNLPKALSIKGPLDAALLERALQKVVDRHDILRTRFVERDGVPQQIVDHGAQLTLNHINAGSVEALDTLLATEAAHAFDLSQAPLIRATLIKVAEQDHVLLLNLHHIVSDAWSNPILTQDLTRACQRLAMGDPTPLQRPSIQYRDYARWQREEYVHSHAHDQAADYWQGYLGNELPTLALTTDFPASAVKTNSLGMHPLTLPSSLNGPLNTLCHRLGVTPFVVLLGAWQLLLGRYSGQRDFTVGVPNATRNQSATQELVGFFVSSQIYRARLDPDQPGSKFLQGLRQASLAALEHADYPIELLLDRLNLQRSSQANPLFQTLFNWRVEAPTDSALHLRDLQLTALPIALAQAKFDLSLDVSYSRTAIHAEFEYRAELYAPETIGRLAGHWQNLLQALVEDPTQPIGELAMLSPDELQTQQQWNATQVDYPLDEPAHRLIEQQVQRTPQACALAFADRQLSYEQLNRQANQLAHKLIETGVGPETLVGIAAERSVEMVVGLLAILKAGGAYVPLDPEYPQERLAYMIQDSGIQLLLTQSNLRDHLPLPATLNTLCLDALDLSSYPASNPEVDIAAENLAYVIYTSGSTGQPKGAGNRHRALTNRLCWMQQAYELGSRDTVLQKTPFSFDVSVWEFFWPLLSGAKLVMALPGDHRDPARLIALIQSHNVSTLHFVPSMLQAFLLDADVARCTALKRIICSGEALPVDTQQQVFEKLPNATLYNLYGPTEAAIDVTHWTCRAEDADSVPIGEPIANLATYILDACLQPVPPGVIGELYLSGIGLARGYHRRPGLTAERFVTSPFGDGERLYRTGDLARYRPNGVIEYRGRIDHQVKIRGLRIELGEIENQLLQLPDVREAVVIALGQQLVGYVVPVQPAETLQHAALQESIKARLAQHLPDYMVPGQWLFLERMPLSANGKLDRKALPAPDASVRHNAWVAPQNPIQQQLVTLWQDVLKRDSIGITDNFFDLGGDSIISIQLVSRARQAGIEFTPKELFEHQTIQHLAAVARVSDPTAQIARGPAQGSVLLLPIQQLFFEMAIEQRQHWNQSVLLKPGKLLDAGLLAQALRALLEQHDALRLNFTEGEQGWTATYQDIEQSHFSLWQAQINDPTELEQLGNEAQRSLNLQEGPLLRAVLVSLGDGSQRLLLVIHHLVVDGVSWRVLFDDLQSAYLQLQSSQPVSFPARSSSLQDWSQRLQHLAQSEALQAEAVYWQQQLQGETPQLPGANLDARLSKALAITVQTRLDQDLTRRLLQESPAAYRTQVNDLLLTALSRVLVRWKQSQSVAIQLEGHGREDLFDDIDLSRSVGWFTTLYPVKLEPAQGIGESIKAVKEQLRAVPNKGLGFGVLRYLGHDADRQRLSQLPTPRITFNYLGQFDSSFAAEDDSLFTPATENAGAEQHPDAPLGNWLILNGRVYGGELNVGWTFSAEMFDEALIQRLADEYANELRLLVEHCANHQGVTPTDFPLARISQTQLDALPLDPRQIQDIYPLAPMQQGMLFHTLHEQAAGNYLNQMRVDVSGLDPERFRQAWQAVLNRHDILRTRFIWQGELEQPLQVVHARLDMPFTLLDWQASTDQKQALDDLAADELRRGFDLNHAPLLHVIAIRTEANRYHLILTHHHILMDGWSTSQLLGEVLQRYSGQLVEAPQGRYRHYIEWLQKQDHAASEAFWTEQFKALDEPTLLARSLLPDGDRQQGHADYNVALSPAQTQALNQFARQQKVTLNTLLQGAWALILQRYTGQLSVCFGATVAGRPTDIRGIEQQVGLFINTLPVVCTPQPEVPVSQWLQGLQAHNLNLREHEHSSLADVQRWAGHAGEALFDTLLVFENYPIAEALEQGAPQGLRFDNISSHEQTNYPLTLIINASDSLALRFNHDRQTFSEAVIQAIAAQTLQGLIELCEHVERPLCELTLGDRVAALADWNSTRVSFNVEHSLAQRIEAQVERSPDAIALSFDGEQLTYAELNQHANHIAHQLIARGVGPEVRVGLAVERGLEMIVGLLAILKAGGAYVPLDPAYPQDRLSYMIKDSGIRLLLAQGGVLEGLLLGDEVETLVISPDTPLPQGLHSDSSGTPQTCGSELAREGNGADAENASTEPAPSRASSLPQKVHSNPDTPPPCRSELVRESVGSDTVSATATPLTCGKTGVALHLAREGGGSDARDASPGPALSRARWSATPVFPQKVHSNPEVQVNPNNLAYVIYTSGSTGQPKGALLTHANVLRLFEASAEHFRFGHDDVWTLFHSCAFDFSVWEIFGALLYGGKLVIVPHAVSRSPEDFHALLIEQKVTVLNQTPSAFKPLMNVACAAQQNLALRYVVFGGEALDVPSLKPWFDQFGDQSPKLINMYGITETTVHVTYRPITQTDLYQKNSPIGAPLADLSWYLLDANLNPVPKGCIGELYVGGPGLARGYLNRQALTATRFIPNLFADDGSRLYRTGDLARYRNNGSIDYLGRSDHQVKIRGFRIELGEIEAQLLAQPQVRQAVVLAQDTASGPQLVAYLVADEDDRESIKNVLKDNLPDYMVPAYLIFLLDLPLTANGKLDRRALPQPDASQLQGEYLAPQTELEQNIAAIWQDVLKLERVGLTDNFFELGGHSLLVIKVVSRLQLELGLQLTPQLLFQAPILGDFAAGLAQSAGQLDSTKMDRLEALFDDMEEV